MLPLDKRAEIPAGYVWRECPDVKALFPMPDTWFHLAEAQGGTYGFFLSRESIRDNGRFITGLTMNAILNARNKFGTAPSKIAESFMTTQTEVKPLSDVVIVKDDPLITYRGFFASSPLGANYYIETTGNDITNTFYYIVFESPTNLWGEDEQIARIMIDNRILNKSI